MNSTCSSSAQSVSTSYEGQLMKFLCETKRIHFHSNKNSLPTCLLPSMVDTARLPILSQKIVDINMTPVILRCPVIVQKYFVFWLGGQQAKCDLQYRENEFVLRFHREKKKYQTLNCINILGLPFVWSKAKEFPFSLLLFFCI